MIEIRKTAVFARCIDELRDIRGRAKVLATIERMASGILGDVAPVGEGVSELRIHHGPGYGVYFKSQGGRFLILLAGGDKGSQGRDIRTALRLARSLKD